LEEANAASFGGQGWFPLAFLPVILIFDCHALPLPSLGSVSRRKAQRVPVERTGTIPGRLLPEIGRRTPKAGSDVKIGLGRSIS